MDRIRTGRMQECCAEPELSRRKKAVRAQTKSDPVAKTQCFPFISSVTSCGPTEAAVATAGNDSCHRLVKQLWFLSHCIMLWLPITCLSDLTPTQQSTRLSVTHWVPLCYLIARPCRTTLPAFALHLIWCECSQSAQQNFRLII